MIALCSHMACHNLAKRTKEIKTEKFSNKFSDQWPNGIYIDFLQVAVLRPMCFDMLIKWLPLRMGYHTISVQFFVMLHQDDSEITELQHVLICLSNSPLTFDSSNCFFFFFCLIFRLLSRALFYLHVAMLIVVLWDLVRQHFLDSPWTVTSPEMPKRRRF